MDVISTIIGGLAFLLSVAHWGYEIYRHRVRIRLADATYTPYDIMADNQIDMLWRVIITNDSSASIGIYGFALIDSAGREHPLDRDRFAPLSIDQSTTKGKLTNVSIQHTTEFPVNLAPHESRYIVLRGVFSRDTLKSLRCPSVDNPEALRPETGCALSAGARVEWILRLRAYTPKRSLDVDCAASFRHVDSEFGRLGLMLNNRENRVDVG